MTQNRINVTKPIPFSAGGTGTPTLGTQYGTIYSTGSAFANTGIGSTGQVLTGGTPSFQTVSSAGSVVLLQTQTVTNAKTVNFTSLISSTYKTYLVTWENCTDSVSGNAFGGVLSTDNGSSWVTSGYIADLWEFNGASISNTNVTTCFIPTASFTSDTPSFGYCYFFNMGVSSFPIQISTAFSAYRPSALTKSAGFQTTLGTYNAIQLSAGGTLSMSGTFSLYGVAQ